MKFITSLYSEINRFFVRRYLRTLVRRKERMAANPTAKDQLVTRIVKAAISDKSSILAAAPLSGKKYIKLPSRDMFIIMESNNVIISNHKFYYDIDISAGPAILLHNRFNKVLEHQRSLMEKEMLGNIIDGLSGITQLVESYQKIKE